MAEVPVAAKVVEMAAVVVVETLLEWLVPIMPALS